MVKNRVKGVVQKVLGPALNWLSRQLGEIQAGVDALRGGQAQVLDRQAELGALQRAVLDQRALEVEVIGRSLAMHRELLESVEAEQRRLVGEVSDLTAAVLALQLETRGADSSDPATS